MDNKLEKIVYFVRHGQSVDNVAPIFQSPDSPLNEKGVQQVECVAQRVSRLSFDIIITSPFKRARQTAEAIAKITCKGVECSELFIERATPTSINGKPYSDIKASTIWNEWEKNQYTHGLRIEDGENFDDLITRVDKALAFLNNREEQSLVVVTHGYFLKTIIARVLLGNLLSGESLKNIQITSVMENSGITVLRYHALFKDGPRWRLWTHNDHAHLTEQN